MRSLLLAAIPCASFVLVGCVDNYHPEYHPVSVSEISQNLSYPVSVHDGMTSAERGPVFVVPASPPVMVQPAPVVVPAPAPTLPPAEWFRGY